MGEFKPPEAGQPVQAANKTKPKTCLDCGFLTIQRGEVSPADRIRLFCYASGKDVGLPPDAEKTQCFRHLWIGYDLNYCTNSLDGVVEELKRPRDGCEGFFPHQPGYTPDEHRQFQIRTPDFLNTPSNPHHKRGKPGRPKDENAKKRREKLREIMTNSQELCNQQRLGTLFGALDLAHIHIPGDSKGLKEWLPLLRDPMRNKELDRVLGVLKADFKRY